MSYSYLDRSIGFKIRKVLRYISLYGVSLTLSKIRSQLHMQRSESFESETWHNQRCRSRDAADRTIAIIGCGNYAYSVIAHYLRKRAPRFLRATCDIDRARAKSLCRDYGGLYATDNPDAVLRDPQVRLVYIASNHASHAEYAIRCIEAGKHVHIEKPHVVSESQLQQLLEAHKRHPAVQIYLGFNRPRSPHFQRIRRALDGETGPTMINWFIAGHEIPRDHWYFAPGEGGRVLGNLCHWIDTTLEIVGIGNAFPCTVVPASRPDIQSDYCVGLNFADGSIAGITFSEKGHTFEGVREVLQAHRGNALVNIRDFQESTTEIVDRKKIKRSFYRDHGHRNNIGLSYEGSRSDAGHAAVNDDYIAATARLYLGVRRAIDEGRTITIDVASPERPHLVVQQATQSVR